MKMKKVVTAVLSAAMVMSTPLSVLAADPTVDSSAPIYSFEVLDVVVPTTYAIAFNPEGLTVKVGSDAADTSTAQILSKSYGMINKGNKDQVITVKLTVADENTGDNKVTFVDSAQEITDAEDGEYKIHLTVVPADTTTVTVGSNAISKDTAPADLNSVKMTGATSAAVTIKDGVNRVGFKLLKAEYEPASTGGVELGTTTDNNVADKYTLKQLEANGKGATAFTFGGEMNANADWTKLTSGIKITAVYSNEVASSDVTVITGTGAMVKLGPVVSVSATGLISIEGLTADKNYKEMWIKNSNGGPYNIDSAPAEWNEENYDKTTGGSVTCQLGEVWLATLRGVTNAEGTLILTDNSEVKFAINIPAENP